MGMKGKAGGAQKDLKKKSRGTGGVQLRLNREDSSVSQDYVSKRGRQRRPGGGEDAEASLQGSGKAQWSERRKEEPILLLRVVPNAPRELKEGR